MKSEARNYYDVMTASMTALLGNEINRNSYGSSVFRDGLPKTLMDTNHRALVETLLGSKNVNKTTIVEISIVYLYSGNFEKVVELLEQNSGDLRYSSFPSFEEISSVFVEHNASDEVFLRYVKIFDGEELDVEFLVMKLWEVGRDELVEKILDDLVSDSKNGVRRLLKHLVKGTKMPLKDIESAFDELAPFEQKEEAPRRFDTDDLKIYFSYFLCELEKYGAPFELFEAVHAQYMKRIQTKQMSKFGLDYKPDTEILLKMVENGDFHRAEVYMDLSDTARGHKGHLCKAAIDDSVQSRDQVRHELYLAKYIEFMDIDDYSDEEVFTEFSYWGDRCRYFEKRAQVNVEKAIYQFFWGDESKMQEYINEAIRNIEMIQIPAKKDCPKGHEISLMKEMKVAKRSVRERFLAHGLLEKLPKNGGWCDPIYVLSEKKNVRRQENRARRDKKLQDKRERREAEYYAEIERFKEDVRTALREDGPDEAIGLINSNIRGVAESHHWELAKDILKVAPERLDRLINLVSRNYFKLGGGHRNSYLASYDGMMGFYVFADELGVLEDKHWEELFSNLEEPFSTKWNQDAIPEQAVIVLIEGAISQGEFDRAYELFTKLKRSIRIRRDTLSKVYSVFIRHVSKEIGDIETGAKAVFTGRSLSDDADKPMRIEYLHCEAERLLALEDKDSFQIVSQELTALLDDPESLGLWVKLMTIFTLRDNHLKKDVLLDAYENQSHIDEIRYGVVEAMIDHKIPGAEAMKEVKSKSTPDDVALKLFEKLVEKEFLHKFTEKFLKTKHLPYLRRLISMHQNQFNTVMEILEGVVKEGDYESVDFWPAIFQVLDQVGLITPGIYAEARKCDFDRTEVSKIKERLDALRKEVFSSKSMGGKYSDEMLAEVIYVTYQPANMSFSDIVDICRRVRDCSHHIDSYEFNREGYDMDLGKRKKMVLKKGERLDVELPTGVNFNDDSFNRELCEIGRLKSGRKIIEVILAFFDNDELAGGAIVDWVNAFDEDGRHRTLVVLKEVFGIYLNDNFEKMILQYLENIKIKRGKMLASLVENLKKKGKRVALKNQLGIELDESMSDVEIAAKVIAEFIIQKSKELVEVRKMIDSDLEKFVVDGREEEVSFVPPKLKLIISKNIASFFAKASAGICTARNYGLFHREDHFHMNIIDEEKQKCVGNVQAYVMEHDDKQYLLLRGFNPSTNLLKEVDVESFCDAVIDIAEKFAKENGLAGVMLSEQGGGFLALSNRDEVLWYLTKKFARKRITIEPFDIVDGLRIGSAYLVSSTDAVDKDSFWKMDGLTEERTGGAAGISMLR